MLAPKVWIPTLIVLLAVIGGVLFYSQKTTNQKPVTIIKPPEVERPTAEKPPPPGETFETGHWHGDEWHAVAYPPVEHIEPIKAPPIDAEFAAYEASLSHYSPEERATYDRVLSNNIAKHKEKYPDCQDHEAVFEDADRLARWAVAELEHRKIEDAAYTEWRALSQERPFTLDYNELVRLRDTLTDAEKAAWIAKGEDWIKRKEAASKRYNQIKAQSPVKPKPRHTH